MKRVKNCIICGRQFNNSRRDKNGHSIGKYTIKQWENKAKYCSRKCYHKWRKGKTFSEKQLKSLKLGQGWNRGTGRKYFCLDCNKQVSNPRSKKCQSCCNKGVPKYSIRGKNHWNWKNGITSEDERLRKSIDYSIWRAAVFTRDNYTCQICGEKEKVSGKLNADHIKPWSLYPELRFAIDNGKTLCIECHKNTDTYMGKIKKFAHAVEYIN